MRRKTTSFLRDTKTGSALASLGFGTLSTLLCIFAFAFVMTRVDMSDGAVSSLASIAVCVGSYFFSYFTAKKRRKDGIITGLCCGAVVFVILCFLNLLFVRAPFGTMIFPKLSMILICAVIGGIIGVNSKIKI